MKSKLQRLANSTDLLEQTPTAPVAPQEEEEKQQEKDITDELNDFLEED